MVNRALGYPEPIATLAQRQKGIYGPTVGWYIDGTNSLGRDQYNWDNLDEARAKLEDAGFEVSDEPVNLSGDYKITHIHTGDHHGRLRNESNALFDDSQRVYLRYGDLPKTGSSYDHANNVYELGVSVFRGLRTRDGRYYKVTP